MERADAIDKLKRRGIFPPHFVEKYPSQSQIILSMMNKDPCLRPTALEILALDLFQRYNIIEPEEVNLLHDREMAEMRDRYTQMKNEKEELQKRLEEIESKLNNCDIEEYHGKRPQRAINESVKTDVMGCHISKILFSPQAL